jgi:type VI secretion system protein ImpL
MGHFGLSNMKKIYHLIIFILLGIASSATAQQYSPQALANIINQQKVAKSELLTINFSQNKNTAGVFQLRDPKLGIAKIYTAPVFKIIYPRQLELAAKVDKQSALTETYIANYAKNWLRFLNNIQLVQYKTPSAILALVNRLASNDSPLLKINTLYRSNMTPQIGKLNQELGAFYNLPTVDAPYNLAQLQQLFAQLQNYLKPLNGDDPAAAAFQLAATRMNSKGAQDPISKLYQVAQIAPAPLQTWLYQLAQMTWQMLLDQAQQHINQAWAQIAIPFNEEFAQTFPFNTMASQQANMNNFVNDFAPDGLFDNFISQNLRPFISTYQTTWATKSLDGEGLSISESSLQTLQATQTIQQLFFPNGDQHIHVPFSLETLQMPKNIKQIIVTLGKQQFSYTAAKQMAKFSWPDWQDVQGATSITFIDKHNKKTTFNGVGPWGWWQVLQQAEIRPSNQNQAWVAIFKVGNENIQMALYANTAENPFDIDRLSSFRLADQLGS